MTDSIPGADEADVVEQLQTIEDEDDSADESWAAGIGEQWDADTADVIEQNYPVPDYDDDGSASTAES